MKLADSGVVFDPENHTYTLNGESLQGITGMLHSQLFPNEYAGVSDEVLAAAASRGTAVHEACELIDDLGVKPTTDEGRNYVELCKKNKLKHLVSEYNVTDGAFFASNIDKVYKDGKDKVILADLKTTYRLNEEYVRWQLSVYAYLFERQNPSIKVSKILAIWLRGTEAKVVELDRMDDDNVERLLECERNGWQFVETTDVSVMNDKYLSLQQSILDIELEYKELENKRKSMMAELQSAMEEHGIKKWETDLFTITIKKGSIRKTFDSKVFAEEHPKMYKKYIKESKTKNSIILTPKKK